MNLTEKFYKFIERLNYQYLLHSLISKGIEISVVFDIGAHKGRWTREHKKIFKNSYFYLFEANKEHFKKLTSRGESVFIGVLSSNGLPAKFYKKVGTGDSLYKENTTHYTDKNYELVDTKTLNQVVLDNKLPQPDFIKLDVQGAELDILEGASNVIDGCKLILAECPISPYNIGSPEISDYLNYFNKIGFTPLRITEQHNGAGALLQVDILFLRNNLLSKLT
jgi:FkbM family methyltransferase